MVFVKTELNRMVQSDDFITLRSRSIIVGILVVYDSDLHLGV